MYIYICIYMYIYICIHIYIYVRYYYCYLLPSSSVYPSKIWPHHGFFFVFKVEGKPQYRRWCNLDWTYFNFPDKLQLHR